MRKTRALELVTPVPDENSVRNRIISYLVRRGGLVIRVNSGAVVGNHQGKKRFFWFVKWFIAGAKEQHGGVTDLLAILPDMGAVLIVIDAKRPGKKNNLTDKQRLFMEEVRKRGGLAFAADCIEDVIAALDANGKV